MTNQEAQNKAIVRRFYEAFSANDQAAMKDVLAPELVAYTHGDPNPASRDAMLQTIRDCSRRALRDSGNSGLLSLWVRTLLDTVQTAIEEHSQRDVEMSKSKFVKLSGWALMIGGLALVLGFLAGTRPEYNQFNARSLPIDQYANVAREPLMVMSMLLLAVGFIGLFLQYGKQAGSFGRVSLGLGALSGVVGAAGAIGLSIIDSAPWWSIFFFGLIFEFLGLALFGLANLRQRTMPRWNGMPLLAGLWIPLYVLVSFILEQGSGNWVQMPLVVDLSLFLLTTISLAALGYLLMSIGFPLWATANFGFLRGWQRLIPILWVLYIFGIWFSIFVEEESWLYPRFGIDGDFLADVV